MHIFNQYLLDNFMLWVKMSCIKCTRCMKLDVVVGHTTVYFLSTAAIPYYINALQYTWFRQVIIFEGGTKVDCARIQDTP